MEDVWGNWEGIPVRSRTLIKRKQRFREISDIGESVTIVTVSLWCS